MKIRVGINGFGRIGKNVLKSWLEREEKIEIVAINSTSGPEKHAHIFKYDSLYGTLPYDIGAKKDGIRIDERLIKFTSFRNPEEIPWKDMGVDIVIESSGQFITKESSEKHMRAGAKKVIITAPGINVDSTIVMGVNHHTYDPKTHHVVSNASCTTNCLAPVAKIINDNFGIESGMMTTVHAFTNDQCILDLPHDDPRRARAAAESIIPTSTGAAKAIGLVIPELDGKLNGVAMRVPTPVVSIVDLVVYTKKSITREAVNECLTRASRGEMKGIIGICELPLVSIDFKKDSRSSIVDAPSTMVVGDKMLKVLAWYDNEWGYSNRVVDLAEYIGDRL